jgi:hypothetical protein
MVIKRQQPQGMDRLFIFFIGQTPGWKSSIAPKETEKEKTAHEICIEEISKHSQCLSRCVLILWSTAPKHHAMFGKLCEIGGTDLIPRCTLAEVLGISPVKQIEKMVPAICIERYKVSCPGTLRFIE